MLRFPILNIHWGPKATLRSLIDDYKKESDAKRKKEGDTKVRSGVAWQHSLLQETKTHGLETTQAFLPAAASCLYQAKELTGQISPWKMGIAAGEARIGDLICCIPEVAKAVIVRVDGHWAQIIGTTALGDGTPPEEEFWKGFFMGGSTIYFGPNEEVELGVDVQSIYLLMSLKDLVLALKDVKLALKGCIVV